MLGELPPVLLFSPAFSVAEHIGSQRRIKRFFATIMLFNAVEQFIVNIAVKGFKELFRDSLVKAFSLITDIFCFYVV
jgi:hypothetical protein